MRIHLTTDDLDDVDWGQTFVDIMRERTSNCPFRQHEVCDDPDNADAILIISRGGSYSEQLRRHPLLDRYYNKTFVYDFRDVPIGFLPGLYCSLPRQRFSPGGIRGPLHHY